MKNLEKLTRDQRKRVNAVSRKAGYGWATEVIADANITAPQFGDHQPYGVEVCDTKGNVLRFFRGMRRTMNSNRERYVSARNIVRVPAMWLRAVANG